MSRELIHIYGPFSIQSFGLIITIGLLLFTWLISRNKKRKKIMSSDQFSETLLIGIAGGIIGGRFLYVLEKYNSMNSFWEIFYFWEGGFSILGTIVTVPILLMLYLKKKGIPILPFFDLIAIYAPLLQSISRIGCFFAGCCYGLPTKLPWSTIYTERYCLAPINTPIHPTQIYSTIMLFLIFIFMRYIASNIFKKPGQLITLYICLASAERFIVGFWRADNSFWNGKILKILSIHQWLALWLGLISLIIYIIITTRNKLKT